MTTALLPLFHPVALSERLQRALRGRGWVTRNVLAVELGASVREIRDAAQQSNGAILAGNDGLKLTLEASQAEVDDCCGRFSSQVSAMTKRIVETRAVWDGKVSKTA